MKNVVILTGASSGIGKAAARYFLDNGDTLYCCARNLEKMKELEDAGANIRKADVTDEKAAKAFVDEVIETEGRVDVLINNAGYGEYGAVEAVSLERARAQLEVNLFSSVRMIRLVAPVMREKKRGKIINVSSAGGRATTYLGGWYHASKYALEAISDSLRMELKPFGIDVALIEPGGVKSPWGAVSAKNLMASAKGTPYEKDSEAAARTLEWIYTKSTLLTAPKKAGRIIFKAATKKRTRARYLFGFGARTLVFLHAALPESAFDFLMKKMYTIIK